MSSVKSKHTILLVDDTEAIRDYISIFLETKGFQVITAKNGKEALHLLSQHQIDLVLLDYIMPEMSGIEALSEMRTHYHFIELPIIMITGIRDDDNDIVRALQAGANDFVVKPLETNVTLARIKSHLLIKTSYEELKNTKEELKQSYEELKNIKDELNRSYVELQRTQAQLVQASKLSGLGEMAAGIAHEINNPLTIIYGFAQEQLKALESESAPQKELLSLITTEIINASRRMKNIINHMREFTHHHSDKHFFQIDPNEPVKNSLIFIERQLQNQIISLKLTLESNLPKIWANATKLESVFLNLFSNARDEFELHPIQVPEITIISKLFDSNTIQITFQDNANGIPENIRDKVFDPFFTTKEIGKGSGLGLSLSYSIIHEHGGTITFETELHKGTKFFITLPVDRRKENSSR